MRDGRIHLANADGGGVVALSAGPNDNSPVWSPDGGRLAVQAVIVSGSGSFARRGDDYFGTLGIAVGPASARSSAQQSGTHAGPGYA